MDGQRLEVFTVIEREDRKAFWLKIGAAFQNRDGSYSVVLDALPVNGKLQLRVPHQRGDAHDGDRRPRRLPLTPRIRLVSDPRFL